MGSIKNTNFADNSIRYLDEKSGLYHREDGPAIEFPDGDKFWMKYGMYHKEDGPAVECANGHKFYHLNGKLYPSITSNEEWQKLVRKILLLG
jgi:hypothetical protein